MATTTLSGNVGTSTLSTVYFSIRPVGAYVIATGASVTNPPPLANITGQWSQVLELNLGIFPPNNYWEVWENVPGADRIWAVYLPSAGFSPTVQQAQKPQPIG